MRQINVNNTTEQNRELLIQMMEELHTIKKNAIDQDEWDEDYQNSMKKAYKYYQQAINGDCDAALFLNAQSFEDCYNDIYYDLGWLL